MSQSRTINKRAWRIDHLEAPVLRALGDDVLTPQAIADRLPTIPAKDVRLALAVLHDAGVLIRISDAQCVLYALIGSEEGARP